jgi:sirohydrochlorin ferrochelatase
MTAVVLLSHGSPDARSSAAAHELARRAARESGDTVVAAFLQHDQPDLTARCRQLADEGHSDVVVVPMLITPAFHARVDVPAAVGDAVTSTGIQVVLAEPVGTDPLLIDALDRLLPSGPVVLAAAGTGDPAARHRLDALAAAWAERRSAPVAVGYASQAAPDVATAIAALESATGSVAAVASFVLYPGVLPDRIAAAAAGSRVTPPLATTPEVIHLIRERVRQALATDRRSPSRYAPITASINRTAIHERTPA